jgi:hypothetical protein
MLAQQIMPETAKQSTRYMSLATDTERRSQRRHNIEDRGIALQRWDAMTHEAVDVGTLVNLSTTGLKFKTTHNTFKPDTHVRVRLNLPAYAGISPFIDTEDTTKARTDWMGWMVVNRVIKNEEGHYEVAGKLVDMNDMDKGMLGLYLSIHPLAG